jgi:hypothetical protein
VTTTTTIRCPRTHFHAAANQRAYVDTLTRPASPARKRPTETTRRTIWVLRSTTPIAAVQIPATVPNTANTVVR